ncbi:TetR/AcrR family transcriptional regulator [Aeromicrobium sp. NPDC092404]|uniref:TetR/AcrR family transcriptional regulator n=1 Tax=Aeromicrobium sp. NPDC092404 TaxID=3154976 RepID=UPI00341C1953
MGAAVVEPEWQSRLRRAPQQPRSQATIAQAVEAADRLLVRNGAAGVTTTRVAAEAGIAVGTLYRYFPDKEALFDALAARCLSRFESLMDDLVERSRNEKWTDPVGTLFDVYADLYRTDAGLRAIWFGGLLSENLRDADRAHKRVMADGLRHILVSQDIAADAPELATICHAAMLASDAITQEAFRASDAGDAALMAEAKTMLRSYVATITSRFAPA